MVPNRFLVLIVLVALLVVTAGCMGDSPASTTPSTVESPTATATDSPVGTSDLPYDLRLRNYGESTTTMNVTVTHNETGERIFSEEVTIDPDEHADYDLSFAEAGTYTVESTVDGTTNEYAWELDHVPPSHELVVTADGEEVSFLRSAA